MMEFSFYTIDPILFAEGSAYDKVPLREVARFMEDQTLTNIIVDFDTIIHASLQPDEKASIINRIVLSYLQYYRKESFTVMEATESFYKYLNAEDNKEIKDTWYHLSDSELCNIAIRALIEQVKGAEGNSFQCLFLSALIQMSYNASVSATCP